MQSLTFPAGSFTGNDVPQAACASNRNNITVVETSGLIFRSNEGQYFESQITRTKVTLLGVFFVDSLIGWAVGVGGTILDTQNAGKNWVRQQIMIDTLNPQTYPTPSTVTMT